MLIPEIFPEVFPEDFSEFPRHHEARAQPGGSAFLGACHPKPLTALRLDGLKLHLDQRIDAVLAICQETLRHMDISAHGEGKRQNLDESQEPPTKDESWAQRLFQIASETNSRVAVLQHNFRALEETVTRQCAALSVGQGKHGDAVRGDSNTAAYVVNVAEGRLETRLRQIQVQQEEMQSQQEGQACRINELMHICQGSCSNIEQYLEDNMQEIKALAFDAPNHPQTLRDRGESSASNVIIPHGTLRPNRTKCLLPDGVELGSLPQVLGWLLDDDDGKDDTMPPSSDEVIQCRKCMRPISALLVLLNTVFVGISLQFSTPMLVQKEKIPQWVNYGNIVFLSAFIIEIGTRMSLDKPRRFFLGRYWFGNWVDLALTISLLVEVAFSVGNIGFLRIIRTLKEAGKLEPVNPLKEVRLLQLFLRWITKVVWPVMCTVVFVILVVFLASLCVTTWVQTFLYHSQSTPSADLIHFFGSLPATMATFFLAISGNAHWDEIVKPLHGVSFLLACLFIGCAVLSIGGILNLLTAIMVNEVILDTREFDRIAQCKSLAAGRGAVCVLRDLLVNNKSHSNGQVKRKDAAKILRRDGKHALELMGLQVPMATGILRMLDIEGAGNVNVEELLCTLSQLQAENVSVHLATTIYAMYETKKCVHGIRKLEKLLEGLQIPVPTDIQMAL